MKIPGRILCCALGIGIFIVNARACSNPKGDAECAAQMAEADYCHLSNTWNCDCAKDCKVGACKEPGNTDQMCDCPFYAKDCDAGMDAYCPYTCNLRATVTCDPLLSVTGAFPLYNVLPPAPLPTFSPSPPQYMDFVTWTCLEGWEQTGGNASLALKRVCLEDGSWLLHPLYQEPLVCQRISCGALPAVSHASPSSANGVFENSVTYACDLRYNNTGQGQGRRTCNSSGEWEMAGGDEDPVCELVTCPAPPPVTNATPSHVGPAPYSTGLRYSCVPGHTQVGSGEGKKRCDETGQWYSINNDPEIVCSPSSCGAVPPVANAQPSSPDGVYRDSVTYACAAGATQSSGGTGKLTCTAAGSWYREEMDPVCTVLTCGAPPLRPGATPSAAIGYVGDNVTYVCDQSHVKVGGGSGHVTCNASALWQEGAVDSASPLCLGSYAKFVNSVAEMQVAPPSSYMQTGARSGLHCASFCAASASCHGYSFSKGSGLCQLNKAAYLPVITTMKKLYL